MYNSYYAQFKTKFQIQSKINLQVAVVAASVPFSEGSLVIVVVVGVVVVVVLIVVVIVVVVNVVVLTTEFSVS